MATTIKHNYGIKNWWKRKFLSGFLSGDVPLISIADASLQVEKAIFLDSREREEYSVSHIAGSMFIGYQTFDKKCIDGIDKTTPLIVYCSIGVRSDRIAKALLQDGFTNVKNLYGGIFEWVNASLPIVNGDNLPTENIHAYNRKFSAWLNKGNKIY